MKKLIYLLLLGCLWVLASCGDKEEDLLTYEATGQIEGSDLALCACCGGFILNIDEVEGVFRVYEYPDSFQDIIDSDGFPVSLFFDYTIIGSCSSYQFVRIDNYELK